MHAVGLAEAQREQWAMRGRQQGLISVGIVLMNAIMCRFGAGWSRSDPSVRV